MPIARSENLDHWAKLTVELAFMLGGEESGKPKTDSEMAAFAQSEANNIVDSLWGSAVADCGDNVNMSRLAGYYAKRVLDWAEKRRSRATSKWSPEKAREVYHDWATQTITNCFCARGYEIGKEISPLTSSDHASAAVGEATAQADELWEKAVEACGGSFTPAVPLTYSRLVLDFCADHRDK